MKELWLFFSDAIFLRCYVYCWVLELGKGKRYQRTEGIVQSEVERQRLQLLEDVRVLEFDGIGRNVFVHAVLARPVRVALDLGHGRTLSRRRRQRRRRLVQLARGPVQRHHPQVRLGLVVGGEHHAVAFFDGVEEESTAVQIYSEGPVVSSSSSLPFYSYSSFGCWRYLPAPIIKLAGVSQRLAEEKKSI